MINCFLLDQASEVKPTREGDKMGTKATPERQAVACPDCKAIAYHLTWPCGCQERRGRIHFPNCPAKDFFDGIETKNCVQKSRPRNHQSK